MRWGHEWVTTGNRLRLQKWIEMENRNSEIEQSDTEYEVRGSTYLQGLQ